MRLLKIMWFVDKYAHDKYHVFRGFSGLLNGDLLKKR